MKSLKRTFAALGVFSTCMLVGLGSYNSYKFNSVSFLKNDFNIKFSKRLDEYYGKVTVGRLAASVPTWKTKTSDKALIEKVNRVVREKFKPLLDKQKNAKKNAPAPTISQDLDLELTGGLYNKKPLKQGLEFSGNAKVVDGVIEEINVSLPGGKSFVINTSERMVGNVFQYEDTNTRELRSGLFYEVKKGTYMITLTDDSQYGGTRLEFKAPQNSEIKNNYGNTNWAMNQQNDDYGQNDEYEKLRAEAEKEYQQNQPDNSQVDQNRVESPYSYSFGV